LSSQNKPQQGDQDPDAKWIVTVIILSYTKSLENFTNNYKEMAIYTLEITELKSEEALNLKALLPFS